MWWFARQGAVELLGLALGTGLAKGPIEAAGSFWLELTGVGGGFGLQGLRFAGSVGRDFGCSVVPGGGGGAARCSVGLRMLPPPVWS